jgi:hypothetical protein
VSFKRSIGRISALFAAACASVSAIAFHRAPPRHPASPQFRPFSRSRRIRKKLILSTNRKETYGFAYWAKKRKFAARIKLIKHWHKKKFPKGR